MMSLNDQNVYQIHVAHIHSAVKLVRQLYAHVCRITLDAHQVAVPSAHKTLSARQIEHASTNAVKIHVRAAVVFQLIVAL